MHTRDKLKSLFEKSLSKSDKKIEKSSPSEHSNIPDLKQEFLKWKQMEQEDEQQKRALEIDKAARALLLERHNFDFTPPGIDKKPKTDRVMRQAEHIVDYAAIQYAEGVEQSCAQRSQGLDNAGWDASEAEHGHAPDLSSASLSCVFSFAGQDGADRGRER